MLPKKITNSWYGMLNVHQMKVDYFGDNAIVVGSGLLAHNNVVVYYIETFIDRVIMEGSKYATVYVYLYYITVYVLLMNKKSKSSQVKLSFNIVRVQYLNAFSISFR